MDKQKKLLKALFIDLGHSDEAAEKIVTDLLAPADGVEPALETSAILVQAQEHFKPILKTALKKELSPEFKGQYMGEAINKIIAASKGKLKRTNYEDGNVEKALADLADSYAEAAGTPDETTAKYNEAVQRIAALEAEKEEAVNGVRSEYAEKENSRMVFDSILSKLGALQNPGEGKIAKKLTVAQDHAAKAILRELGDEYVLKYDPATKTTGVFNKAGEVVVKEGKVVDVDSLLMNSLTANNWIAQSNGGTGGKEIINRDELLGRNRSNTNTKDLPISNFRKNLEAQVGVGTNA